jgi:hypothetical protein
MSTSGFRRGITVDLDPPGTNQHTDWRPMSCIDERMAHRCRQHVRNYTSVQCTATGRKGLNNFAGSPWMARIQQHLSGNHQVGL